MDSPAPVLLLNTGAKMPVIGLGMSTATYPDDHIKSLVLKAIEAGYRHFVSASQYNSERGLGNALNEAFKNHTVTREEVFVTSKLWCSEAHPDDVLPSFRKSLEILQLAYVDLYLFHWPVRLKKGVTYPNITEEDFLPLDIRSTWKAMEKCVELGLTKSIGVSNFSCKKIEDLLGYAKIPPAVNQVEMHPMWQQQKLREHCSKLHIHVSAWAPLGSPGKSWGSKLLLDSHVIQEIAQKYSKTTAQLSYVDLYLFHWPMRLKKGVVLSNIKEDDFLPLDTKSTWQAMEKCLEHGLTKSIGLSNFSRKKIEDLLGYAKIPPALNQVEMHPMWQQRRLREYCSKLNIHICAWAPLGAPGKSWGSRLLLDNHVIQEIAQKYSKTAAQVALRWGIEQGVSVVPKSFNEKRLDENFRIFDFQLSKEDHEKIGMLEQQKLFTGMEFVSPNKGPYTTLDELWDGEI